MNMVADKYKASKFTGRHLTGKAAISGLVLAVASFATTGAAFAGSPGNARFEYAPNVWKVEGVRVPSIQEAPHAVKNGAVPQGPGFLGLSPQLLSKPPAPPVTPVARPQVQTQVAARPTYMQATPQASVPKFSSAFGKAGSLPAPPVVANNPPPPAAPGDAAMAQPLPPQAKAAPARAGQKRPLVAQHSASRNVHGVLTHRNPAGLVADAGKRIESYGAGYVPGAFLPAAYNGDGSSTQSDVHGRLLRR